MIAPDYREYSGCVRAVLLQAASRCLYIHTYVRAYVSSRTREPLSKFNNSYLPDGVSYRPDEPAIVRPVPCADVGKKISTQRENASITINISGCGLSGHLPNALDVSSFPLLVRRGAVDAFREHRRSIVLVRAFLEIRDSGYSRNQLAFGGKNPFDFRATPKFPRGKVDHACVDFNPLGNLVRFIEIAPRSTILLRLFELKHI